MIRWIGCPDSNFRRGRPFGLRPEAIVVHIMDGSFSAGESVFRDPTTHKSAHYGIARNGEIHQYVDEGSTAFHAGIVVNPSWTLLKPRVNPNFYTIGIEHEGRPDDVWPDAQLEASAMLVGQIAARWQIPLDDSHVIGHHQIRASKSCPGNWLQIKELLGRLPTPLVASAVAPAAAQAVVSGRGTTGAAISPRPQAPAPSAGGIATVTPANVSARVMVVRTIRNVNLRRGKPATSAQLVSVIPAHTEVAVARFETGEPVSGNAYWYEDLQGNYLWAGATNAPDPTVLAA